MFKGLPRNDSSIGRPGIPGLVGQDGPALSHGLTVIEDLSFCLENEEGSGREMKSVPSGKGQAGGRVTPSLWDPPHRHNRQLHG